MNSTDLPTRQAKLDTDRATLDALLPAAYERLRLIASGQRRKLPVRTLATTALINEAWLKLMESQLAVDGRDRFFGLFAQVTRNVLIDHIRKCRAGKRDAQLTGLTGVEDLKMAESEMERLVAIDEALNRLAESNGRLVKVVEMRFFAGFGNDEIADILGVNEKTVRRDWLLARAYLARLIADDS